MLNYSSIPFTIEGRMCLSCGPVSYSRESRMGSKFKDSNPTIVLFYVESTFDRLMFA